MAVPDGSRTIAPSAIVGDATLYHADCRDVLRGLPDNSIDSVVTDPPYALVSIQKRFGKPGSAPAKDVYGRGAAGFMGKAWDTGEVAFSDEFWAEVLRVLKPGGHVVAFSGTRTYHRMAVAIEDAGFEIRDQLGWVYGSGFPKSHDVSKGIDKAKRRDYVRAAVWLGLGVPGNNLHDWTKAEHSPGDKWWEQFKRVLSPDQWGEIERAVVGQDNKGRAIFGSVDGEYDITAPATEAARQWQGWGTALKPAWEPICLARKPLDGTVAANVLKWGTGALNIDGCRVAGEPTGVRNNNTSLGSSGSGVFGKGSGFTSEGSPLGRWPANIVHDGSDEVLAAFPDRDGASSNSRSGVGGIAAEGLGARPVTPGRNDSGSAARFFYAAKASRKDRDEGLEGFKASARPTLGNGIGGQPDQQKANNKNTHPTVKPTALMQWLCRLVTPPGGVILDPFMGSGSTGKAALLEGFKFIGCEREDEYMPIAQARIAAALRRESQPAANDNQLGLFDAAA